MAKSYVISVTDGVGTKAIVKGAYNVASNTAGFDNSSILPKNVDITDEKSSYEFTIAADGTLSLRVTETGSAEGTPVVGAKFYRCDKNGNTYGDPIVSGNNGLAVFNYVPYSADGTPPVIYYKQTESDGDHDFDGTLSQTTMTGSTSTLEITNPAAATKTVTLTDANYTGLPIASAEITLSSS